MVNAVRNYQHAVIHDSTLGLLSWLILQTREGIVRGLPDMNKILTRRDGTSPEGVQFHFCILTDREAIAVGNFAGREAEARALRDRLAKEPARVLNHNGDRFVHSGDYVLFSLATTESIPGLDIVGETNYHPVPDYILRLSTLQAQCIRNQMITLGQPR